MIQPIRNNVVVRAFKGTNQTDSGLVIPDNCIKESDKVEIVAVGCGTAKRPMKRKVGEIGYRVHEWGTPFEYNGENFYLMDDNAIIALQ